MESPRKLRIITSGYITLQEFSLYCTIKQPSLGLVNTFPNALELMGPSLVHDGTLIGSDFYKYCNKGEVISRHSRKERWKMTSETDTSTPEPWDIELWGNQDTRKLKKGKELSLKKTTNDLQAKGIK